MKKVQNNIKIKNFKKAVNLLGEVESLLGAPYKYGAYSQKAKDKEKEFDCSSFVQYVYKKAGVKLPRSTIFQAKEGEEVKGKNFLLGDVLFFRSDRGHYYDELFSGKKVYIGHVAIFLTNDLIVHAKSSLGGVVLQKLSELQEDKNYEAVLAKRYLEMQNIGGCKISPLSQLIDIKEKKWQKKSCGIVSFCMLVNFLIGKKALDPNKVLIQALTREDFYIKNIGWTHKAFVFLAKEFGLLGKAYNLAEKTDSFAFGRLAEFLEKAPVMVSIYKDLNPKNSGHLVVVSGIKNGKVQYYDPNTKTRKEVKKEVDVYQFIKGWKRRFVVINKK
jgi:cell wall-associated NlpC family hydrolase